MRRRTPRCSFFRCAALCRYKGGRCSSEWRAVRSEGPGLLCSARRSYDRAPTARRGESTADRRRHEEGRGRVRLVRPVHALRRCRACVAMRRNEGVPAGCNLGSCVCDGGRPADTPLRGAHAARLDFDTALRAGSITGGRCSSLWRSFAQDNRRRRHMTDKGVPAGCNLGSCVRDPCRPADTSLRHARETLLRRRLPSRAGAQGRRDDVGYIAPRTNGAIHPSCAGGFP